MKALRTKQNELFDNYYYTAIQIAKTYLRNECDVFAVVSRTMEKVLKKVLIEGVVLPNTEAYYVRTMIKNSCIDELRKQKRHKKHFVLPDDKYVFLIQCVEENDEDQMEQMDAVKYVVANLEEDERAYLHLKFYEGVSYREAARELNMPENNVGTFHTRTLNKLRKGLKDNR